MSYASQQDLVDRFGERELIALTDRSEPPTDEVDEAVLGRALADADGEIDAYVGRRYPLPLDPVPTVLVPLACDIVRYRLASDSPRSTEEIETRYKRAVAFLRDIADGKASLGPSAPPSVDTPVVYSPGRLITRDTLRDF